MALLTWDETGERTYETGVDHGVLYIPNASGVYNDGVAWNGLVSVSESPSGAESNAQYADNIKYLNLLSAEDFSATIEAFTYPDEFAQFDGLGDPAGNGGVVFGQQSRGTFGLSYRTIKGNDVQGDNYGYKLHLVYGCQASPSEKAYSSINDSPEAITFSWEISTTATQLGGTIPGVDKPTALVVIDSTKVDAGNLEDLEAILYDSVNPTLPTPYSVYQTLTTGATTVSSISTAPAFANPNLTLTYQAGVDWFVNGDLVTYNDGSPFDGTGTSTVVIDLSDSASQLGVDYTGSSVSVEASPATNSVFAPGLDTLWSVGPVS